MQEPVPPPELKPKINLEQGTEAKLKSGLLEGSKAWAGAGSESTSEIKPASLKLFIQKSNYLLKFPRFDLEYSSCSERSQSSTQHRHNTREE